MNPPTYLAKLNHHPRDDDIEFDEGPHIYTIKGRRGYTSVTTWNHSHFKKFDADNIIDKMMASKKWEKSNYFGKTKVEIKAQWKENGRVASEAGTKLHYDIECFYNLSPNQNNSIEYQYFKNFYKQFEHLKPYRTEWMIWDESLLFAGSIDMIFENPDGTLDIYDWKRCKEIKKYNNFDSATTVCIEHLPDTNFWHYSLQLNTYKALLEKNYDKRINKMYLVCLHPNKENFKRIPVPNLSSEIKDLFELRANMLNNLHKSSACSL